MPTSAKILTCSFNSIGWGGLGLLNTCDVMINMENDCETVTNTGHDIRNDVYAFRVNGKAWSCIPNGIARLFPNIRTFQIITSGLKQFSKNSFQGFSSLTDLNLLNNYLRNIDEDSFEHLAILEGLYLGGNGLTIIHPRTLFALKQLKVLHLQENNLEYLPRDLFIHNVKLSDLLLNNNRLSNIPCGILNGLTSLSNADFSANVCIDTKMGNSNQLSMLKEKLSLCDKDGEILNACQQKLKTCESQEAIWKNQIAKSKEKNSKCEKDREMFGDCHATLKVCESQSATCKKQSEKFDQNNATDLARPKGSRTIFDSFVFQMFFGSWKFH